MEVAKYEAVETLRDGRQLRVRALKPDDRAGLLSAVSQSSAQSLYRRFFSPKRVPTENEVAYFMDVNFVDHVALVAVLEEDGRAVIIGGGRYVLIEPGKAEVAFVVVDRYQEQGVGTALMRKRCAAGTLSGRMRVGESRAWRAIVTTIMTTIVTSLPPCGHGVSKF